MKTIFDQPTADALINRIETLSPANKAQWGKMDCFQMLRHCSINEEIFLGKRVYGRLFIGRLFGRFALNKVLTGDVPMKKNLPTHPDLIIKISGDVEAEKARWIGLLKDYKGKTFKNFIHPFFGSMTHDQIGRMIYKHTDHHLRQFNA